MNNNMFEDEIEMASEKLKDSIRSAIRMASMFKVSTAIIEIGMVLGSFALTSKIIQEQYNPTGLYKLGKLGISYAVAAEVAKSLNSSVVRKGDDNDRTE